MLLLKPENSSRVSVRSSGTNRKCFCRNCGKLCAKLFCPICVIYTSKCSHHCRLCVIPTETGFTVPVTKAEPPSFPIEDNVKKAPKFQLKTKVAGCHYTVTTSIINSVNMKVEYFGDWKLSSFTAQNL